MADPNCKLCKGEGWKRMLVDSDHGTFKEDVRCMCNPAKWSTVLDFVLGFHSLRAGKAARVHEILDMIHVNLDRETEDELKKLLTQ